MQRIKDGLILAGIFLALALVLVAVLIEAVVLELFTYTKRIKK